ncbi:hypothetical protein DRE_06264 [Drechslerella stenobrocha 248]|uniref:Ras-related protein Rab-18 n=1 Tax=Drechslerella stenobrocha 248 TaxID=1043628 RepID=W7I807_9PEZI|nr:hypothetical protein DRE_06264 [Drechslerella stenobrocha 248]
MSAPERPTVIKVLLIGPASSGKTSLLKRYVDDVFEADDTTTTIGVEFREKKLTVNKKLYRLLLQDTAGQDRFRTLTSSYYRGAHGILLIYDISNRDSFLSMPTWFGEAEKFAPPGVTKILVGNKTDRSAQRAVSIAEGEELARKLGALHFFETSAKTKDHAKEPFQKLVDIIISTPGALDPNRVVAPSNVVDVSAQGQSQAASSCAC